MDILTTSLMLVSIIMATTQEAGAAFDFNATIIGQLLIAVGTVATVLFGIMESRNKNRQGSIELKKSANDILRSDNELLVTRSEKLRKDSDKWHLLRTVVMEMPNGKQILAEVEKAADELSAEE